MLLTFASSTATLPLLSASSSASRFSLLRKFPIKSPTFPHNSTPLSLSLSLRPMSWLGKLGFGNRASTAADPASASSIPQGPDDDIPAPGQKFVQFGAGCFWGVELAFQRVPGVTRTEVGYSQGFLHNPSYNDVCSGTTNHSEVVRVQFDPKECSFQSLLDVFWSRHDPTTLNRQGGDVGTQYRSGIYFYTPEQEQEAKESLEKQQQILGRKIVTEILPAKKFYRAEEYHQQYLSKGGRFGFKQFSFSLGIVSTRCCTSLPNRCQRQIEFCVQIRILVRLKIGGTPSDSILVPMSSSNASSSPISYFSSMSSGTL